MKRTEQRDITLKLLYETDIQKETPEEILNIYYDMASEKGVIITDKDKDYIERVFFGVFTHKEEIDNIISSKSKEWNLNRISKLVTAALRLSIFEINYCEDIPHQVSINEAVNLVKLYCGEEPTGFVNGILATLVKKD